MSVPLKVKKRITPTNLAAAVAPALVSPAVEEDDDPGPIGPRKNPNPKKVYGNKTKLILERLHVTKLHKNSWIDHVKKFSEKNGIPYACALSNPSIKKGYEKGSFTTKSNVHEVVEARAKRAISPEREASPKRKKSKAVKKTDELAVHIKVLKKLGMDNTASLEKKRVSAYDKIFEKYNKPLSSKEDKAFVKERHAQSERDRKKRMYFEKKYKS
jgi:hypothetical protein